MPDETIRDTIFEPIQRFFAQFPSPPREDPLESTEGLQKPQGDEEEDAPSRQGG